MPEPVSLLFVSLLRWVIYHDFVSKFSHSLISLLGLLGVILVILILIIIAAPSRVIN